MENLPLAISLFFILTASFSVFQFYRSTGNSNKVLLSLGGWALVQIFITLSGFYEDKYSLPPRLLVAIMPPLIITIVMFNSRWGKRFIDSLDKKQLTLLHAVRIPVELVLFWLFLYRLMPELMTFEGRNMDILSGISAPFVYLAFRRGWVNNKVLLVWNFACLVNLLLTVINAMLSAPSNFQQFAFDQPNVAVFYFPFILLPSLIVPIVYFSHLAAIRQLLAEIKTESKQKISAIENEMSSEKRVSVK